MKAVYLKDNNNNKVVTVPYYRVGDLFLTTITTNPSNFLGGKWELFGPGRCLVCVDTSDSDFNTVKKTGGEKTHTLTIDEMPSHTHTYNGFPNGTAISWADPYRKLVYQNNNTNPYPGQSGIDYSGGNQAHNNLQPYITCYVWIRTA